MNQYYVYMYIYIYIYMHESQLDIETDRYFQFLVLDLGVDLTAHSMQLEFGRFDPWNGVFDSKIRVTVF